MKAPAPIVLDFLPVRRPSSRLGWVALAVALAVLSMEGFQFVQAHRALDERAQLLAELQRQRASEPVPPAPVAQPALTVAEVQALVRVSTQLDADWGQVFVALDRVRGEDVAWIEIEGEALRGALRLTGQARSLDAVLAVLGRMRNDPVLAGAELGGHELTVVDGVTLVRFVMTSRWSGA